MKLSDVMSAMNLASYAEVGLVLFLVIFVTVVLEIVRRGRALEELASLPLDSCCCEEHSAEKENAQ
jgi:hypothetical protein